LLGFVKMGDEAIGHEFGSFLLSSHGHSLCG